MKNKLLKTIKEYVLIHVGLFFVSVGIMYFLAPDNLATGGVSGLGIVLQKYYPAIPIGLIMIFLNLILFTIGIIVIGKGFGIRTIYCSFALSGMFMLLEKAFPINHPLTDDYFIQLALGIIISGIGMAIVFSQNASTGGTDIIAKIINKITHIKIGVSLFFADVLITVFAGYTFGIKIGMYSFLGVLLNSYVIDNVIAGFNVCKQVVIISIRNEEIKEFIMNVLNRGVTVYHAEGGYSKNEKIVLCTILTTREFLTLKNFVKSIDKEAFVVINNIHEALGEGFIPFDH